MAEPRRVALGEIGRAHGVRGWLRVRSFTTPPEEMTRHRRFHGRRGETLRALEMDRARRHAGGLIAHFAGFDDPEAAGRLTGLTLLVDSGELPELEEGAYYWHELEGLEVVNLEGRALGRVERMMETGGANDVMVLAGTDGRETLIPYVRGRVVREVDLARNRATVDWEAHWLK